MSEGQDKTQSSKPQQCPECGSTRVIQDQTYAEVVCITCGCVLASNLTDRGPEWRAFNHELEPNAQELVPR